MGKIKRLETGIRRLELAAKINKKFAELWKEVCNNNKELGNIEMIKMALKLLNEWLNAMIRAKPQETTFIKSAIRIWENSYKKRG